MSLKRYNTPPARNLKRRHSYTIRGIKILRSATTLIIFGSLIVVVTFAYILLSRPAIYSKHKITSPLLKGPSNTSNANDIHADDQRSRTFQHKFKLKHIHRHGVTPLTSQTHQRLDVNDEFLFQANKLYQETTESKIQTNDASLLYEQEDMLWTTNENYSTNSPFSFEFNIKSKQITLQRLTDRTPKFIESYLDFAYKSPQLASTIELDWNNDDQVIAPDVTDKETIISLALMSSNAYVQIPQTGDWRNVSSPWNGSESQDFGWDGNGIRGHVFVNELDNIVVISVKGTSAQGLPGSGIDETTVNDKINDNLLFSCCCARVSYLWTTVCDCYVKSYTCDESCLEKELRRKDRYYNAVIDIYKDVLNQYPNAEIWVTGHSLGGALAALIGRTFGLPAVAFEAPGEYLAAKRLHLPFPPGLPAYLEGVWHFGHTADPIFMGTCNGASSSCSLVGYAMETSCHTGRVCVYDVVNDKGWRVNMLNHRIHKVIDEILTDYDQPAKCLAP
ncbi:triglyceride lipase ATG15 NDAI_0I00380 [Naumovozyma dairenensis CBS 421]|uniref:Putative lipase ATG15 n=1 Tax=Naumovozyma dairenensis (strain ATCC 10597 / BCRC 20456 / CBS 421 / NBRC 0211 / NRRL Y-12639) TaxID=1071378 RepID=G0WFP6_NAUDC|nr:hypothetical protein NDAI_0I00380 [Naumovozyma dairenensis CBS 421]CCD26607.1 hypothetical protein NDAI_0I00380 [Naumovozyma dairenensis CBS 421]